MWTADHTCGRREAVDESGEQPEGQPNRLAMTPGSKKRPRAKPKRQEGGDVGKKKGRETDQTTQRTHSVPRNPLANNRNPNKRSSRNSNRSSKSRGSRGDANVSATVAR